MIRLVTTLFALLLLAPAWAAPRGDEASARAAVLARFDAALHNDVAALDPMLGDDLDYCTFRGDCLTKSQYLELVKSGRLRALGLSGAKRVAALPDVPTFAELKLDDINWMAFFGLIAPKDTPAPIVMQLNAALVRVLATPDMRNKLAAQQAIVVGNSPEAFKAEIARELSRSSAQSRRRRSS